ncbi:MAG: M36 family metallopeptidase, partial [Planctomycetes bacterium]|nr:M36 family metallopeptidase [Planctomycetota bacterium]
MDPLSLLLLLAPAAQQPAQLQVPSVEGLQADRLGRAEVLGERFLAEQGRQGSLALFRDLGWSRTADRVVFERVVAGYPVRGEVVKVVMFRDGSAIVEGAPADLSAAAPLVRVGAPAAERLALAELAGEGSVSVAGSRLAWEGDRLVWEVRARIEGDGTWHEDVLVDAASGELAGRADLRIFHGGGRATGAGQVFDPNPVQTLDNHGLKDSNDANSAVPASEYYPVALLDLTGSGYLDGPYASTSPTSGRAYQPSLQFIYQRNPDAFEEVMCYYHVDAFQRYLQAIGQANANNRQQRMDVNGTTVDNSWYDLGTRIITYGSGGVDDAEDADIIIHEYGHALHHDVQGSIGSGQNGAMSEGYGDYFAASFYDDALVGEWDAVSYTGGSLHYLRRVDENKYYPQHLTGWVHDDGEIWSAGLWDFRMAGGGVGATTTGAGPWGRRSPSTNGRGAASGRAPAGNRLRGGAWRPSGGGAPARRGFISLPAGTVVLSPADSTPVSGAATTLNLAAAAHGGKNFKVLASRQPGANPLGPPYNVTIHVGLDLLAISLAQPGFTGTLSGGGTASIPVTIPPSMVQRPGAFQAGFFGASGGPPTCAKPCALGRGTP